MKNRRVLRTVGIGLALVWAVGISIAFYYLWNFYTSTEKIPEADIPGMVNTNLDTGTQELMEGYWSVALFGVDSREGKMGRGTLSDLEMVCNINLGTGEIRLVSIYRDTFMKIDEKGNYNKINEAYFEGGPSQAVGALNENLDLIVDDYAAFNWKAVVDAINLLGGIDLEISQAEFKVINGFITETVESTGVPSVHLKKAGMNHLDGVQAVAFARLRKMDTDFQRTKRQREVVSLVLEKARKADFSVLNQIMVTVIPQISTSIGVSDVMPLIKTMKKFHLEDTAGFPFQLEDQLIDRRDCVVPVTLYDNVKELHLFLFNEEDYEPSAKVKEISDKIIKLSKKKEKSKNVLSPRAVPFSGWQQDSGAKVRIVQPDKLEKKD